MEVDSAQPSFSSVAQSLDIDIKDDSSSEGHTLQGASSEILPVDSSSEGHALQGASAGSAEVKIVDQGGVTELTGRITQLIQRLRTEAVNNLRSTFRQRSDGQHPVLRAFSNVESWSWGKAST